MVDSVKPGEMAHFEASDSTLFAQVHVSVLVCRAERFNACMHQRHIKQRLSDIQSTLIISNFKLLSEILRDIRTPTYQLCRIEETIIRTTTCNKYICNWTLRLEIY